MGVGPNEDDLDLLLRRLEFGVSSAGINLIDLPLPLARDQYMALVQAGMSDMAAVRAASHDTISAILGSEIAEQLDRAWE